MIKKLTAHRPIEILHGGRTLPLVVDSVDEDGKRYEVVAKFFIAEHGGARAKIAELFCSLLAQQLGLQTPMPYLIQFPEGFADTVTNSEVAEKIRQSNGLEFSSHYYPGLSIVPPHMSIPRDFELQAASIMTFDGLIQNPDRRVDKPNLLKGDEGYYLIDHDMALDMFDPGIIGGTPAPWDSTAVGSNSYDFLKSHLFNRGLKGKEETFTSIEKTITSLSDATLMVILDQIPEEWWLNHDKYNELKEYFNESTRNSSAIVNLIKSSLPND